jgi:hypothetical protein
MHESERLLFAVAADAEQFAGGMPGQLQKPNQTSETGDTMQLSKEFKVVATWPCKS